MVTEVNMSLYTIEISEDVDFEKDLIDRIQLQA